MIEPMFTPGNGMHCAQTVRLEVTVVHASGTIVMCLIKYHSQNNSTQH